MAGEATIGYIIEARDRFSKVFDKMNSSIEKVNNHVNSLGSRLKSFGDKSYAVGRGITTYFTLPLIALGGYMVHVQDKFEDLELQFKATTGSAQLAHDMMQKLGKISTQTPLPIEDLAKGAQMMMAYGFNSADAIKKTEMLSKVSAGFGIDLKTLSAQYGRVIQTHKFSARQMMVLSKAGVPIITMMKNIAKEHGISDEVFTKMLNKGKISSKLFEESLEKMTAKGGIAYEALIDRTRTFSGSMTILNNILQQYALTTIEAIMGDKTLGGTIADLNKKLDNSLERYRKFIQTHPQVIRLIAAISGLVAALGGLAIAIRVITFLMDSLLTPTGIVISLVAALAVGGYELYKNFKPFRDLMNEIWQFAKNLADEMAAVGRSVKAMIPSLPHLSFGGGAPAAGIPSTLLASKILPSIMAKSQISGTIGINVNDPNNVVKSLDVTSSNKNVKFNTGNFLSTMLLSTGL